MAASQVEKGITDFVAQAASMVSYNILLAPARCDTT